MPGVYHRLGRSQRLLSIALGLVLILVLVTLIGQLTDMAMRARVEQALRLRAESGHLLRLLVDLETGVRGFVLSGDAKALTPYTEARAQLDRSLDRSRRLAAQFGETPTARLTDIDAAAGAWLREVAEPAIAVRRAGTTETAALLAAADAARSRFDRIRAAWNAFDREVVAITDRETNDRFRFDVVSLVLLGSLGLGTLALMVLGRRVAGRAEGRAAELAALVESLEDGVVFYDARGRVVMANAAAHGLFTLPAGLLVGRSAVQVHHIIESRFANPEVRRDVPNRLLTATAPFTEEVELARPAARTLRRSVTPVNRRDGARIGWLELYEDITAARELERARTQFVATAAHDLRNPLTAIRGRVQLLRRQFRHGRTPAPEQVETAAGVIERQTEHMAELVTNLLDLSRANLGRLDLRPEPVDLAAVVRNVIERIAPPSDNTGKADRIQLDLPPEPVRAFADRLRLEQALANLVGNAIKYAPPPSPVRITLDATPREVSLTVADRGPGIEPEALPRLGEPFFRTEHAAASATPGTGLGLAIVRAVADAHGGRLEVASTLGEGSAFRLVLPRHVPLTATVTARAGD